MACSALRLPVSKPTLVDVPVSNHGARVGSRGELGYLVGLQLGQRQHAPFSAALAQVRHIIYNKGLENEFDVVSPAELGGLGSEQYMALNPQNKMPLLLLPNGQSLPESEVCVLV